jgi:hypothetical protein
MRARALPHTRLRAHAHAHAYARAHAHEQRAEPLRSSSSSSPTVVVPPSRRAAAQALRLLDEELDTDCCVCFERLQDTRLEPCGHSTFCAACVEGLQICPLCREPIDTTSRVLPNSAQLAATKRAARAAK